MKQMKLTIMLLASLLFLLVGCSSNKTTEDHEHIKETHHAHTYVETVDIHEETPSKDILPTFLLDKHENISTIYLAAAKYQSLLETIPCFCGCGESVGHRDNYDCFIYENKEDGSIIWDDHGTKCGVCLEIAAEAILMFNEGKSQKEIREYIDEKYNDGFPEPTQTRLPEEV